MAWWHHGTATPRHGDTPAHPSPTSFNPGGTRTQRWHPGGAVTGSWGQVAPVGSPWDRDGDGGATSGQPPQSRGGWKTSPKGPANPNTRWDHTGGGIVVPCGCHPPVPKRQGPPEVTFSLLQVLGIHQHHSVCKGRAAGWEGGGDTQGPLARPRHHPGATSTAASRGTPGPTHPRGPPRRCGPRSPASPGRP